MLEALKITKKSFHKYLQMPLRENESHLDYEAAKLRYIVNDTLDSSAWRCVSKPYFLEMYRFVTEAHTTQFRTIKEIKMPTGYPKDPAAHTKKMAAKVANSGKPVVTIHTTPTGHKKRVYKKQTTPRKNSVAQLSVVIGERDGTIEKLKKQLSVAHDRNELLEAQIQRRVNDISELNDTIDEVAAQTRLTKSVGMAIMITEKNRDRIAVVNGGLVPEADDSYRNRDYFFFPYDYNAHTEILTEEAFFAKYRFGNTQDESCFVDVDQI